MFRLLILLVFLSAVPGGTASAFSFVTGLIQQRSYDDLHRLTSVTSRAGIAMVAASDYTLDVSGRRSRTVLADGTWWKYTYDGHGQVTAGEMGGNGWGEMGSGCKI